MALIRLLSSFLLLIFSLSVSVPIASAVAHPGGLDASGCHHNRKTGEYHCHRAEGPASRRVSNGQAGRSVRVFQNCAEARAAGAAPVRSSDPGYSARLDRDGDGIGCE